MFSERSSGPSPMPAMARAQAISFSVLLTGLVSFFLNSAMLIPIRGKICGIFDERIARQFLPSRSAPSCPEPGIACHSYKPLLLQLGVDVQPEIETAKIQFVDADGGNRVNRDETGRERGKRWSQSIFGTSLVNRHRECNGRTRIADFLIPAIIR